MKPTGNRSWIKQVWKENRGILLFILLMAVFRSSLADWNYVPSASMRPTLIEGDRVLINKLAYDINIPFLQLSVKHLADPKRGDVIIFESEAADLRLIKRVVGIPGDTVSVNGNRLSVNGKPFHYEPIGIDQDGLVFLESATLGLPVPSRTVKTGEKAVFNPDGSISVRRSANNVRQTYIVPEQHYFVMGDSRDNSADSRYYGFVPRGEIIGRSRRVVFSHDPDNYYIPRKNRWLTPLEVGGNKG